MKLFHMEKKKKLLNQKFLLTRCRSLLCASRISVFSAWETPVPGNKSKFELLISIFIHYNNFTLFVVVVVKLVRDRDCKLFNESKSGQAIQYVYSDCISNDLLIFVFWHQILDRIWISNREVTVYQNTVIQIIYSYAYYDGILRLTWFVMNFDEFSKTARISENWNERKSFANWLIFLQKIKHTMENCWKTILSLDSRSVRVFFFFWKMDGLRTKPKYFDNMWHMLSFRVIIEWEWCGAELTTTNRIGIAFPKKYFRF